jgi:hypothetical protein
MKYRKRDISSDIAGSSDGIIDWCDGGLNRFDRRGRANADYVEQDDISRRQYRSFLQS